MTTFFNNTILITPTKGFTLAEPITYGRSAPLEIPVQFSSEYDPNIGGWVACYEPVFDRAAHKRHHESRGDRQLIVQIAIELRSKNPSLTKEQLADHCKIRAVWHRRNDTTPRWTREIVLRWLQAVPGSKRRRGRPRKQIEK